MLITLVESEEASEMQKLYFEPAWDRTVAPADREKMMNHFQQQTKQLQSGVHFSFFKESPQL